jgi:hypothetical protein
MFFRQIQYLNDLLTRDASCSIIFFTFHKNNKTFFVFIVLLVRKNTDGGFYNELSHPWYKKRHVNFMLY